MTYSEWCQNSTSVLKEASVYNEFRKKAKYILLTNIGPRIAKLGETGYYGSGFHYGMEQTFGKLISIFSMPWQPSANWCEKVEDDRIQGIVNKVLYCRLLRDVNTAERSVPLMMDARKLRTVVPQTAQPQEKQ